MTRLKEMYQNTIMDNMMKKFGYKNVMQVPKLDKIVINMGVGEAKENPKALESAVKDMGQQHCVWLKTRLQKQGARKVCCL